VDASDFGIKVTVQEIGLMIELELGVLPSVNSYYGRAKTGQVYIKKAGKKYRNDVILLTKLAGIEPLDGPVIMEVDFYPPSNGRHDGDNILKSLWDSLEGYAYWNDDQIVRATVEKMDPIKGGRVDVRIVRARRIGIRWMMDL